MRIQKRDLKKLALLFEEHSPLFVVGGYVRNKYMDLPLGDIDLCSACSLQEVAEILKGTEFKLNIKNKKLGTAEIIFGNNTYEYSTFREETYKEGGKHSPNYVRFDTNIIQDAKRRDFTVNCIYYSLSTNEIIDFYGGIQDITKKCLRTVETPEEVLRNDGARILRLARFASELAFKIEKRTLEAAKLYCPNIKEQSIKTKFAELEKIITCSAKYKNGSFKYGIKLLDKLGAWKYIFNNDKILSSIKTVYNKLNATKRSPSIHHFVADLYNYYNKKNKVSLEEFNDIFLNALV